MKVIEEFDDILFEQLEAESQINRDFWAVMLWAVTSGILYFFAYIMED